MHQAVAMVTPLVVAMVAIVMVPTATALATLSRHPLYSNCMNFVFLFKFAVYYCQVLSNFNKEVKKLTKLTIIYFSVIYMF